MIVSHQNKLVVIGIPKTGSRSFVGSLALDGDFSYHVHSSAVAVKDQFGKVGGGWDDYYKLAVTRNPWDRYYSLYNFIMIRADPGSSMTAPVGSVFKNIVERAKPQHYFYADEDGQVILDRVGKFEDLQSEFDGLCDRVGLEGKSLAHLNETGFRRALFRDIYDDTDLISLIAEREAPVIRLHGYEFDDSRMAEDW